MHWLFHRLVYFVLYFIELRNEFIALQIVLIGRINNLKPSRQNYLYRAMFSLCLRICFYMANIRLILLSRLDV